MNKEEILKRAQGTKVDEREMEIKLKAQTLAGRVSTFCAAVVALFIVVDGYILESYRTYDFWTVAWMFIGAVSIHNFTYSLYALKELKEKKLIPDVLCFGAVLVWAAKMLIGTFI